MKLPRLIGTIHLPPLPGSPGTHHEPAPQALQSAGFFAVQEAEALVQAGFEAVILQNRGDMPFFESNVPPETVASMSIIAAAVRESITIPVGIRILKNDPSAALAIASITGCEFITCTVPFLEGGPFNHSPWNRATPAFLVRERDRLHSSVAILAETVIPTGDIDQLELYSRFHENVLLSGVDAAILKWSSGILSLTGSNPSLGPAWEVLKSTAQMIRKHNLPLYLESQIRDNLIPEVKSWVDGVIATTEFRRGGTVEGTIDTKKAREWVQSFVRSSRTRAGKSPRKQKRSPKKKS